MKFAFEIKLHQRVGEDEKKPLETFTGEILAPTYDDATGQAWLRIQERVRVLRNERGIMVGCGTLQVEQKSDASPRSLMSAEQIVDLVKQYLVSAMDNERKFAHLSVQLSGEKDSDAQRQSALLEMQHCAGQKLALQMMLDEIMAGRQEGEASITPQQYQEKALQLVYPDLTTNDRLGLCGLGLPGEVGEVTDLLKKHLYYRTGKALDTEKLKDELGDVLWYFSVLCSTLGLTFEQVMEANIAKLEKRHPDGFNPRYMSDSGTSL